MPRSAAFATSPGSRWTRTTRSSGAYRGWLLERGIYVHPHYMIRGFLTGAHTEADVDRLVEATADFLVANKELASGPRLSGVSAPGSGA